MLNNFINHLAFDLRSGSIVTNEGKPRRAVALKLKISPKYYTAKKRDKFSSILLAIGLLLPSKSRLADPHLLVVHAVNTP